MCFKAVKIFRFFRSLSVFEEAFTRGSKQIAAATIALLLIILAYSFVGYLVWDWSANRSNRTSVYNHFLQIFGLNSIHVIRDFQDFQNSFYSMFRVLNRNLDARPCYEAMPAFTIFFFLSFYFGIFFIFAKYVRIFQSSN